MPGHPIDRLGPEQHRVRYLALRQAAMERARSRAAIQADPIRQAHDEALHRETIPAGWYWSVRLPVGGIIKISNLSGRASVSLQIWNAADPVERFNAGDTIKLQWSSLLSTGRLLFSDMGRVLASIVADAAAARHDVLAGGSTPDSNARRYGDPTLRNTRDNFRSAAAKLGLSNRDVHPCVTLFAGVRTDEAGSLVWQGEGQPGEFVELRAEMPLLMTLSNCPHPLDPGTDYDPGEVEAVVIAGREVAADDPCRTSCEEAERGFDNSRSWLAMSGGGRW